ncbi:hypothetical protein CLV79_107155 [Limimaricola soesokkakensis]|uniref:Uncharacterized protein n=1 Tax=Limimaricola soesokkakensis TaxID=1343159 RepID=A0A1X6ZLN1_9RHOB|nr:hypothetical protein CLV79_107155 [Limimaricola soesokkakensis]SLN55016.1 hypothetical protein LOS8367_02585 [Limimaricola soesokkakensis]
MGAAPQSGPAGAAERGTGGRQDPPLPSGGVADRDRRLQQARVHCPSATRASWFESEPRRRLSRPSGETNSRGPREMIALMGNAGWGTPWGPSCLSHAAWSCLSFPKRWEQHGSCPPETFRVIVAICDKMCRPPTSRPRNSGPRRDRPWSVEWEKRSRVAVDIGRQQVSALSALGYAIGRGGHRVTQVRRGQAYSPPRFGLGPRTAGHLGWSGAVKSPGILNAGPRSEPRQPSRRSLMRRGRP